MKELIGLIIFAVEFVTSCIATIADVVIKIFTPFSKIGHAIGRWCERTRAKLCNPKQKENVEQPQDE